MKPATETPPVAGEPTEGGPTEGRSEDKQILAVGHIEPRVVGRAHVAQAIHAREKSWGRLIRAISERNRGGEVHDLREEYVRAYARLERTLDAYEDHLRGWIQ